MVAPDLVAQDASKITSDILGAAEKEDFFGNIGKFAKRARDDLELAKLNTVSVGELDKLLKDITGQAEEQTGRNTDKFEFNGQEYAKSRLVLAVVKEVFRQRNFQTIDDLKEAFPDTWYNNGKSNKWGVVSLKEKIEDPTRWFCKPDDALDLGNKLYAVVRNQWGIDNILYFVKEANKKYNLSIKNIKSQKISHNRD